jgi:RNA polymerase sigma-70 factor (ECF subfamily)
VHRSIASFQGDSLFRTWLHRIAYRCFLSEARKRTLSTETLEEHHSVAEDETEQDGFMQDFNRAMMLLSQPQREAVHFSLQQGFAHPDIADIMGIPVGTVKTHVLRGRQKLQELLSEWKEDASNER